MLLMRKSLPEFSGISNIEFLTFETGLLMERVQLLEREHLMERWPCGNSEKHI